MRSGKIPTLLLFTLLLAVILVGCGSETDEKQIETTVGEAITTQPETTAKSLPETTEEIKPVEMFNELIEKGEYLKAIDCYNTYMYGNIKYEKEAERILSEYCENVNKRVLAGEADLEDANTDLTLVYNITSKTNILSESELNYYIEEVETSLNSKAAYAAAVELQGLKNWKDALESYKKVIQTDSNYIAAQNGIIECTTQLKTAGMNKAAGLAQAGNYIEAISVLETLSETLTNDSEIIAKITVYEKTYINSVIEKAKNTFKVPTQDWKEALDIIEGALAYYPNNSSLLKEEQKYSLYSPIYLHTLTPYKNDDWFFHDAEIDNTGKKQYYSFYSTAFYSCDDKSATYDINRAYNSFSFTFFTGQYYRNATVKLEVLGDGKILYTNEFDVPFKPINIEIDISNIEDLTISIDGSAYVGISYAKLQKTK